MPGYFWSQPTYVVLRKFQEGQKHGGLGSQGWWGGSYCAHTTLRHMGEDVEQDCRYTTCIPTVLRRAMTGDIGRMGIGRRHGQQTWTVD